MLHLCFFLLPGNGTTFPATAEGQMFCILFAAVGIPLTIIFFKHIGKLVSLSFENLVIYLKHKGMNEVSSLSPHITHTNTYTHVYASDREVLL